MTLNGAFHSDRVEAGGFGSSDDFFGGQRALFLRNDHGWEQVGGTAALSFGRAPVVPAKLGLIDKLKLRYPDFEIAPDLGSRIGSRDWWRGAATCAGLITLACMLSPGFRALPGEAPAPMVEAELETLRSQSIAPLALGANSGQRMAATRLAAPLKDTPERPIQETVATLGSGSLANVLQRSGLRKDEASTVADLIGGAVSAGDIKAGTRADIILGRRTDKSQPRPLEKLAFRARFDLALEVMRSNGTLVLNRIPISIDRTPLRIRGQVGGSLYRSARAAGVPAKAIEAYIKAMATRMPIGRLGSGSEYDIIIEQARAETGEVQLGGLLFAGLNQGKTKVQLVRWEEGGRTTWFDASGRFERKGTMGMPVNGRLTSGFGMRRHPVLRYARMHKGLDIAAPHGTPIRAAMDGVVAMAGRAGGYGNFVKLNHGSGYATGYGHMSRIAVRPGTRVSRGQVIGYVGSTGISTGPHLHYELWKNGMAINPRSVSVSSTQQLGGAELQRFRSRVASLLATPLGAGGGR